MTDKELIQALRYCPVVGHCADCPVCESCEGYPYDDAADRLEALLAENEHLREATKMIPQWVSVSERLPENDERVLVTVNGKFGDVIYIGGYMLAEYVPGEGWILEEFPQLENPNVTYWCELPEPPSTEGVEQMKRCDPRARAKCPDRKFCELGATFADGSQCDKFNEKCLEETPTIADHIRAMSDFELAQFLWKLDSKDLGDVIKFCGKRRVCDELDVDEITEGMCQRCLLAQLQQPYESEETP